MTLKINDREAFPHLNEKDVQAMLTSVGELKESRDPLHHPLQYARRIGSLILHKGF